MHSRIIAGGIALVGYGALVGWAATADIYERKMKSNQQILGEIIERKTKEVAAAKDAVMQKFDDRDRDLSQFLGQVTDEPAIEEAGVDTPVSDDAFTVETIARLNDRVEEGYDEEGIEAARDNLQGLINNYTNDPDAVNNFAERGARMEVDNTPPFVISKAKFAWDEEEGDEYDKITLTYYPRERVLLDDEQDVIEDVANVVGWANLSRFGDESEDAEVVFVRNRRLATDFEVVRDTENQSPAHVRYGMSKDEFETNKAAGLIRFRPGDV